MGRVLCVASDLGALTHWLGEGRGVLLPVSGPYGSEGSDGEFGVPRVDVSSLAAILADRPRVEQMVETARAWAEAQTWVRRAEQWAELLLMTQLPRMAMQQLAYEHHCHH